MVLKVRIFMVKKLFFLWLLACPLILFANGPVSKYASEAPSKTNIHEYFTNTERGLVNKIWSLVKKKKFHTLKKMMTEDFHAVGMDGVVVNRSPAIIDLTQLKLISYQIQDLVLTRTKDSIIATYMLFVKVTSSPTVFFPIAEMSTFQKVHGKWKWKADADMNQYPLGNS